MAIDIDAVLEAIGETGSYQRRIYFLLCLPIIFVGASNFAYIFIAATPRYRCQVEGCDSENADFDASFVNFSIPRSKTGAFESCLQFERNCSYPLSDCFEEDFTKFVQRCPTGILFDDSVFESTIVTEFNMTCSNSWQASADQSVFFAGILVGCFLFGFLADVFGRRPIILICIVMMSVTGVVSALVPNIYSFHALRFFNAIASAGLFQTCFILGMEFVGPSKRVMFGIIGQYFFAFGEILLGLIAWSVRSWRMLQLIISAPVICFIFYYWVVPESIRWLQAKGRHLQVVTNLESIARINKKTIPLNLLAHRSIDHDQMDDMELTHILSQQNQVSLLHIARKPVLLCRWLFLIFIWITTTLCYYGLSYSTQSIQIGDASTGPFIFFIVSAVIELPGYTLAWIGMQHCGRKWSLVSSLVLGGLFTIGVGYVKNFVTVLTMFMFGKCFSTSAFAIIYVFTAELFPTSVRNSIVGTCSMFARIGGMLAPFADHLKDIYLPLPMLLFGSLSVVSGLLGVFMPETKNVNLPDTIDDALNLGKSPENRRDTADAAPEEVANLLPDDDDEVLLPEEQLISNPFEDDVIIT